MRAGKARSPLRFKEERGKEECGQVRRIMYHDVHLLVGIELGFGKPYTEQKDIKLNGERDLKELGII